MSDAQTPGELIGELTAELMGELGEAESKAPIAALVAVWVDGGVWWRVEAPEGNEPDARTAARLCLTLADAAFADMEAE